MASAMARAVKVLPEHDRRHDVTGEPGVPVQVVVTQGLLDPRQALPVQRPAARQGLTPGESLVVVRDQGDPVADRFPDAPDRREVVGGGRPPDPHLQGGEPAFGEQFQRLVSGGGGRDEPQPVAVVGRHRLHGPAEQPGQRQPGRLGQHVPQGDVDPGHRGQRQALIPGQAEPAPGGPGNCGRRGRPPA
jgi:hypothetical protein